VIRAVKGMRDILPPSSEVWNKVEFAARRVLRQYNYQEIRTPLVEETTLFARGVGEETDIVSKEMYTFEDRDGSSLTLRPENTASVLRAYIEHRLDQQPGLQKLYYLGPMFRRERPQKGRYRQFFQIGAEAIGTESPFIDAEVLCRELTNLKLPGVHFRENYFQPTFHKFAGQLCNGAQLHVTDRESFRPFMTGVEIIKCIRKIYGEQFQWKQPPYEYEWKRLPIEILIGGPIDSIFGD